MTNRTIMKVDNEIPKEGDNESPEKFKARMLWYEFKEAVINEDRFFVNHKLLDILSDYMANNVLEIEAGHIYYRARIIDDNSRNEHMLYKCMFAPEGERLNISYVGKANPFKGLTKEASFVPPKKIQVPEGRANPKYVRYLYVSESATAAIFEVRPFIFDAVNVAQIKTIAPLKIANISVDLDLSNRDKNATVEKHVMGRIQGAFSKPTNNPDDYIPTQVIAGYIKSLGYDGIRFNSSLHKGGVNLTIFNYEKCEASSSQHFIIEDIKLTARAAVGSANYQGDLFSIRDNEPIYLDWESLRSRRKKISS